MAIPLIVWGGAALVGVVGIGGYTAGKTIGDGFNRTIPYAAGATALYLILSNRK